jgi:hypothetical protein
MSGYPNLDLRAEYKGFMDDLAKMFGPVEEEESDA